MSIPRNITFQIEDQKLFERNINQWTRDVRNILFRSILFSENIRCEIKTITFSTDTAPSVISLSVFKTRPFAVQVMSATNIDTNDGVYMTGNAVSWTFDASGTINIQSISGLSSATRYSVTLALLAG